MGGGFRFDPTDEVFLAVVTPYRTALRRAEKIWRRLALSARAKDARDGGQPLTPSRARLLEAELSGLDAELDLARDAILTHVRRAARNPMRERVKNVVGAWRTVDVLK